jgi:hypothetical protein
VLDPNLTRLVHVVLEAINFCRCVILMMAQNLHSFLVMDQSLFYISFLVLVWDSLVDNLVHSFKEQTNSPIIQSDVTNDIPRGLSGLLR